MRPNSLPNFIGLLCLICLIGLSGFIELIELIEFLSGIGFSSAEPTPFAIACPRGIQTAQPTIKVLAPANMQASLSQCLGQLLQISPGSCCIEQHQRLPCIHHLPFRHPYFRHGALDCRLDKFYLTAGNDSPGRANHDIYTAKAGPGQGKRQ